MQRYIVLFLLALVGARTPSASAQVDAEAAFLQGKTAYTNGEFGEARDLFLKASQTDTKNPEVFLWLGKAEYQLGRVDGAIDAWSKTVRLAPNEPYADQMLKALRGQLIDVDISIALLETSVKERLFSAAGQLCSSLLRDNVMTDIQRVKVLTLQGRVLLATGAFEECQKVVHELLFRQPQLADAAETTVLLGSAKLRAGGKSLGEGLTLLKKVAAEHAGTPAAATAEYELAAFDLEHIPTAARAKTLEAWLGANPEHPMREEALGRLITAYLAITQQGGRPSVDAQLSPSDVSALEKTAELIKRAARPQEAHKLVQRMTGHFDAHYAKNQAYAAAISGCEVLLKAALPPSSRLHSLQAMARYQGELALSELTIQVKAGQAAGEAPGQSLQDALATYRVINSQFPSQPAWRDQAELAGRVQSLASIVPWSPKANEPKAPQIWAIQIALPVVRADSDAAAVAKALNVITAIRSDCEKLEAAQPSAAGMALAVNSGVLDVLKPTHPAWPAMMLKQADLLSERASAIFRDNIEAGKAEDNAVPGEYQKQFLTTLTKLVEREAGHGPKALEKLGAHLQPWLAHGHYKVAEEAYGQIADSLGEAEGRRARLSVATLWRQQVFNEHGRIAASGLTVPRKLDVALTKALELCCSLQEGVDERDPFLQEVRGVWDSIVTHYLSLEYFDVAEQAIAVRPSTPATAADAYAKLQQAALKFSLASRELGSFLREYGAVENITLTPAFTAAIEAYQKFIEDHPTSPLADVAVAGVFNIAGVFEAHNAYDIAAGVYKDFAAFGAKVAKLAQAAPGSSSTVERAVFAAALALDKKARLALSRELKDTTSPGEPPAEISAEFAAALTAYIGFAKTYPESPLVAQAVEKVMAAGLEYAKADAWDVADAIYAGLLKDGPGIRRIERIEFCRGLCQLGKAMPDHAREVLTNLALKEVPRGTGSVSGQRVVAKADSAAESGPDISGLTGGGYGGTIPGGIISLNAIGRQPSVELKDAPAERYAEEFEARDSRVLAAIRKQEASRAARVAQLREQLAYTPVQQVGQQPEQGAAPAPAPPLSEAEIARQGKAFDLAYEIFQSIRRQYPQARTAEQARAEIKVMIEHWRTINQWPRAAALSKQFLEDNPSDRELPGIRLAAARDYLAWAAQPVQRKPSRQLMLAEVAGLFTNARDELARIITDFPRERTLQQDAQWDIANSFLTQARVVGAFSPTLARGQYVRAATELLHVAEQYYDHPKIAAIPQMLWDIGSELTTRQYFEEAISVWNDLALNYPTHAHAQEAALRIAQTYQNNLEQPLRAAEAYQEVNTARGGNDAAIQNTIYQIGVQLKAKKRWVEALHVLAMFVDSFPRHAQAGQALTTIGQIHQTNEAWEEAIAAYRRVIAEFPSGDWVKEAKWSIAECVINLSRWREATDRYADYLREYPDDARKAEAERRVTVLKDLARYQTLVDEEGQRKAFDAQHQIATIVLNQLSNQVKAIIEYRKVAVNWPNSHLADDALYAIGTTYLAMGRTDEAREAALAVAREYPNSPMADDALYLVGKSFEDEAQRLGQATRAKTVQQAQEFAQSMAYQQVQDELVRQRTAQTDRIEKLKSAGDKMEADMQEARYAGRNYAFNVANIDLATGKAGQVVEALTTVQLANRQDKINAALRKAVGAYEEASRVAGGDKAGDALLRMATIYDKQLKDPNAAVTTWLEIVRQFSGTAVAEDASWRLAQYYEREGDYANAVETYKSFLRNYRRSTKASDAQFAVAENYEHLGQWVDAMDAYTNYLNNFPEAPKAAKAREQINWIKAYRL